MNLDDGDDVYNWPWLYAVRGGRLEADRRAGAEVAGVPAARRILHVRRFLGRAGVGGFDASMSRVFPDRPIVEIDEH